VSVYRFGEFVLDNRTRQLLRDGEPLHVSPKAFQLLAILTARAPAALSKSELQDRLWPHTFVVEANLQHLVGEVRTLLGDDPRTPRFVRTVYGYGYAFIERATTVPVRREGVGIICRLLWSDGRATLTEGEHVVGRDPDADVVIDSPSVSRRHAFIRIAAKEVRFEDMGSKNGSYIGERRIEGTVTLADRDDLRIGLVPVKVRLYGPTGSTETAETTPRRQSRATRQP
jgi:DNA-binding winged helix-turn-helix (wHTH) protein